MTAHARAYMQSPVGWLRIEASDQGLTAIRFLSGEPPASEREAQSISNPTKGANNSGAATTAPAWTSTGVSRAVLTAAVAQLEAYFAGRTTEFDVLLDLRGTPFQLEVWEALQGIPWGTVVSYGELARRIGRPGAARAVGAANGANPIPIVVPCHRVITSRGTLGGYSAGIERKRALLALEGLSFQ